MPGGSGGSDGGGIVPFTPSPVRLVDSEGLGVSLVWVVVRNAMGDIVAVDKTNASGLAVIVTEGPQGVMLDAVQVGVAGVPFAPGTNILVVVDD